MTSRKQPQIVPMSPTTRDEVNALPLDDLLERLGQVIGIYGIQAHAPDEPGNPAGTWLYRVTFDYQHPFMQFTCHGNTFPNIKEAAEFALLGALAITHLKVTDGEQES